MEKVYIRQSDIFKMVEETNGFKQNQKVTGWHYSGDDEIVFDTNKTSHETEHYYLIEFVEQVDANFKEANDMKCNRFDTGVRDGEDCFFFYRYAGSTPCHKEVDKIYVSEAEVYKAIERDCGYRGRQHITGWWYGGDDIAFDNNRKEWGAEHYSLIDFVAAICRHIPKVNDARCNQFGFDYEKDERGIPMMGTGSFFFYRDIGSTDCHKE